MRRARLALVLGALAFSGCTLLVESHRLGSAGKLSFEKTLVIASFQDELRPWAEDELARRLPALNPTPSHRLFRSPPSPADLKRLAGVEGFDGVVEMWLGGSVSRYLPVVGCEIACMESHELVDLHILASVISMKTNREVWRGDVMRFGADGGRASVGDVRAAARWVARGLQLEGLVD